MIDLTILSLIGLMGRTNRGECQGGMLVVAGNAQDVSFPEVKQRSWVEYGPSRSYDRVPVSITPEQAWRLVNAGWIKYTNHQYLSAHYIMTEKAWRLYTDFDKWVAEWVERNDQ